MGCTVLINQGFTGFVVQLLQGGGRDASYLRHISFGFQVTGARAQNSELNFSHGRYLMSSGSIFGLV